jgi:hypothetical protein
VQPGPLERGFLALRAFYGSGRDVRSGRVQVHNVWLRVGETARQYIHSFLFDSHVKEWIRESAAEPEFIDEEEAGLI